MNSPGSAAAEATGADAEARRARPLDRAFIITIVAATVVVLFLYAIREILLPFVGAGIVAFVVSPVVRRLTPLVRNSRTLAAVIVFLALFALFLAACFFAGPPLVRGIGATISRLPALLQAAVTRILNGKALQLMGQSMTGPQITAAMLGALRGLLQTGTLMKVLGLGVGLMATVVLGWVLLFYFLTGGPAIASGLVGLLPPPHRDLAWRMWGRTEPVLRRYFLGMFVIVGYAIVAAYLGLGLALHIQHAVLLAIATGFLEIIPVAGPIASAVVVGLVAVQQAKSAAAILGFLVYAVSLRLSIDQLVGPIVLGRAARVHPAMVIFCFLSGALLFNVVGVVLAVPVALTIKIALATLYGEPPPGAEPRKKRA